MVVPLPQSKPSSRDRASRNANAAQFFTDLQSELSAPDPRTPVAAPRSPVRGRPLAKLYRDLTPLEQEARDKQGIETLKGLAVGIPAGLLGLPADLAALIFRDAPQLAAKLVTGQELEVEERTFIDKLVGDFQRAAGAEAIIEKMGFGADLLPEEDEKGQPVSLATDALSQAGVTPFRAGSLISEVATPIPTGAGIARLLGRRSNAAGEVLPPERVDPTISTTSDELGDIIEGSVVERLENPYPADSIIAELDEIERVAAEELAAAPPEPPTPAANFIQTRDDVIDDGNGVFEFDQTGRLETGALTDDELVQRYIEARDEFTAGMAARPEGPLDLNDVDNLAQDAADRAGTRMGYIQNELIGRRDGHFVQLTDNELAEIQVQEAVGEMLSKPDEPEAPASLAVTDTNNNIIPEAGEGFQGLPGGIGALDESMPIYGNYNLTIGSMPDEFKGSVIHYSPSMTNYQNFVGSRAFARQQGSDKKLEAKQWLAALNKNPESSQKIGTVGKEIKNSEFENIMLSNPEKKYNETEIRRLLTSRLPQTRSRTFLESKSNQEYQDGDSPFSSLYAVDAQYRPADLNSARDKGLIIFSNTAPTIDVPGFGRLKPKPVHNYYGGSSGYPGYYAHGRFLVVESSAGKKYMQINELQSNSVSDVSSGSHLGGTRYVKTLEDRLQAYRDGYESVRVPYTPEVHKIMKEVQDLKPEVITTNDVLARSIQENAAEITKVQQELTPEYGRQADIASFDQGGQGLAEIKFLGPIVSDLRSSAQRIAKLISPVPPTDPLAAYSSLYGKKMAEEIVEEIFDTRGLAYTADDVKQAGQYVQLQRNSLEMFREDGTVPYLRPESRRRIMNVPDDADTPSADVTDEFIRNSNISDEDFVRLALDESFTFGKVLEIEKKMITSLLLKDDRIVKILEDLSPEQLNTLDSGPYSAKKPIFEEAEAKLTEDLIEEISRTVRASFDDSLLQAVPEAAASLKLPNDAKGAVEDVLRSVLNSAGTHLKDIDDARRLTELGKTGAELVSKVADIADDVAAAQVGWNDALANLPNAEDVATLMDIARITGQERRGFIEALPYNSDEDFYKFAFRAANKEAEKLGLDGVIYPDAAYLSTQPQRSPNDAFLRNYGRVIDGEIKELTKADENAGVRLRKVDITGDDPFEIIGRGEGFEVNGVDPNDLNVQEALQPFRTEVRNADRDYKQAKATVDDLERQGTDTADMADELEEERLMRTRLENVKATLETEMRRRSTTYNSELRVVEFDNDANKQLARRPIRRATGGMVRSGIGAMAREVM
tara:strand:+ start:755 stop:4615 length:3861 start_codon:yes stop_codon:yes gene_type:complete